jgi:hypothetical protein
LTSSATFACTTLPGVAALTVTDAHGQALAHALNLSACPPPPPLVATAKVSAPTYVGNYASATYTFTGTASGGMGSLTTTWSGPAPLPSALLSPTVTFACSALAGSKTVTFTVTDTKKSSLSRTVTLAACPAPLNLPPTITKISSNAPTTGVWTNPLNKKAGAGNPLTFVITVTATGVNGIPTNGVTLFFTGPGLKAPKSRLMTGAGTWTAIVNPTADGINASGSISWYVVVTDTTGKTVKSATYTTKVTKL